MERRPRILIVGAGIAGAASAWHLARRGAEVHLFEAASSPDLHSSGRNAAILRSAIPDPRLHRLARHSAAFYRQPPADFSELPLLDGVGLVLAAAGEAAQDLAAWLQDPALATTPRELTATELQAQHPYAALAGYRGFLFAEEGVLDVHALHQAFLHGAIHHGATLHLRQAVQRLAVHGDRLDTLHLADGSQHQADAILLATGGWGDRLLQPLGLSRPMVPRRRHLLVTAPTPLVDPKAPVLWMTGPEEFYFRPESGGLLLSACDSEATTAEAGEQSDSATLERAMAVALRHLPGLGESGIAHAWAGMRTFQQAADGFLLGPDAELPGLHWAAALGGHGMSTAYAVGETVADGIFSSLGANSVDFPGLASAQ